MSNNFETGDAVAHTCPSCGGWIRKNEFQFHICRDDMRPPTVQYIDPSVLERIAKALETIAEKLK